MKGIDGKMIREANEKDLNGILALYQQLFNEEDYSNIKMYEEKWKEIFQNNYLKYFVAIENGQIISTCNIAIIPNMTRNLRSFAVIENVFTHEDFRKKGYGKKVIEKAIEYAKKRNCYKVMLLSSKDRIEAHRFYERIGFDGNSKKGFQMRID
jgi:GNAT superfamily N-acetyltransferase